MAFVVRRKINIWGIHLWTKRCKSCLLLDRNKQRLSHSSEKLSKDNETLLRVIYK